MRVERAVEKGSLSPVKGSLAGLNGQRVAGALSIGFDNQLGYALDAGEGRGSGNGREGSYPNVVITDGRPVAVQMEPDRSGRFDPVAIPKHVRRLDRLSEQVISLLAEGMTTGDIQKHLFEIHGSEISRETILQVADGSSPSA